MARQIAEDILIRTVDADKSTEWTRLLQSSNASLFHTPAWMRVVTTTYGIPIRASVLEKEGQPVAGVAWAETDDLLGKRRVTIPCADFCDILSSDPESASVLAREMLRESPSWNLRSRSDALPRVDVPIRSSFHYLLQRIDLTQSDEDLWAALSSAARRGVRKAQREGIELRSAKDVEELREWFLLHLRVRKSKHHLLAQPFDFFKAIWDEYVESGNGFLLLALHEGKIIGGDLFLLWNGECYYKFNASDTDALQLRPNNILLWEGMLEAKARGCTLLDLGRSPFSNTGLIAFKRGFGAVGQDLKAVIYASDPQASQGREAKDLLGNLTRLFVDEGVSQGVAERAGALLYRYFV